MNRDPRGVPTGGQFAASPLPETDVHLEVPGSGPVALDPHETNDMLTEMAGRLGANIDDNEMDALTHQVIEAFEAAQSRTARNERIAATVGSDASTAARAISEVGERLGLKFERDPHSDFDDWQADLGGGRALVLSAEDTNLVTFVGEDGQHHVADVVDDVGYNDYVFPRFDKDGGDRWLRRVRPSINEAAAGGNLSRIAWHLEHP